MKSTTAVSTLARTASFVQSGVRCGFTLVELLVVITIIVVLAGLVFVLSTKAINSAEKAVCVTNFRSIGSAIQLYAVDHNSRLPGPLNQGQYARFNGDSNGTPKGSTPSLTTYIAQYLQGTKERPGSGFSTLEHFGCPSLLKRMSKGVDSNPVVYRMEGNYILARNGGYSTQKKPWGYPDTDQIPWCTYEIDPLSAGRVIGMIEQDQTMGGTWNNNGASGPAHGNQRMAMHFDGSVKPLNVTEAWK